jgi:hypothetical protein
MSRGNNIISSLRDILDQATKLGVKEHIEEISVPVQNIVEVKRGVRVNTERKIFPGYILIVALQAFIFMALTIAYLAMAHETEEH